MEEIAPPKRLKNLLSQSSSTEQIAGDEDILSQILLRLTAKSLTRFKCVSMQWRNMISGKWFSTEHVLRNPKPSIGGFYYLDMYCFKAIHLQGHSLPRINDVDPHEYSSLSLHDSSHGLILCSRSSRDSLARQIIVCNPTTQTYMLTHQTGIQDDWWMLMKRSYLYFNPNLSPIYKIILILQEEKGSYCKFCVYTSNCSTWKTMRLEGLQLWGGLAEYSFISSDGVIHMITKNSCHVQFNFAIDHSLKIRMFDDTKRTHFRFDGYFGENVDGNLVIVESSWLSGNIAIYEMDKREGRHWVLKQEIDIEQQLRRLYYIYGPCVLYGHYFWRPRVFWCGETEDMDLTTVLEYRGKVFSYNHKSKETNYLCDLPNDDHCRKVHPFVVSLTTV